MKIKEGKIYLCTKSLIMTKTIIMSTSGTEELTEGKLYKSNDDEAITDNMGRNHYGCEKCLTDQVVVNTPTQEDWDYVSEKLGYKWHSGYLWTEYLESTCINLNWVKFSPIDFYKEEGYSVVSIDTFKELFNDKVKVVDEKPKSDTIVTQVTEKFKDRSTLGIEKYNTTLQDNPDGVVKFLNHLQEELMDATLYIQKLKNQFEELKSKL